METVIHVHGADEDPAIKTLLDQLCDKLWRRPKGEFAQENYTAFGDREMHVEC